MRRILLVLIVFAAAVGAALYLFPRWLAAPAESAYRTAKSDRGSILATVNASGTINPVTTVIVGSQLSGQVVEILADYNSQVKSGQLVARLNSDQIRARLDAAKADLAQVRANRQVQEAQIERVRADTEKAKAALADSEAQVVRNEALLADAERAFARQSELQVRGFVAQAAFDTARATRDAQRASLDSARAQVRSAKAQIVGLAADLRVAEANLTAVTAQVAQREASVRQIDVDLRNTDIRSPVSGTVIQRNVELGQTVAASLQAPTLFLIADDLRHMEIAANIDETDVGRVQAGQRVSFSVTAYPGRNFEGTVKQVRLGSQTVQNVVIYTTIISVENPRRELLPGMTANLRIETERRENVVRIPNAALRWRPASLPPEPVGGAPAAFQQGASAQRGGGGRSSGATAGRMTEFIAAMKSELKLQADQEKEVEAALAESRASFSALRNSEPDSRREASRTIRAELERRIEAVLDEKQKPVFDGIRQRFATGGEAAGQSARVYLLVPGNTPEGLTIRIGATDGGMTEVLTGLPEGRDVIVGGGPRTPATRPAAGPRFGF